MHAPTLLKNFKHFGDAHPFQSFLIPSPLTSLCHQAERTKASFRSPLAPPKLSLLILEK